MKTPNPNVCPAVRIVMAGLVEAIATSISAATDGRDTPGHDGSSVGRTPLFHLRCGLVNEVMPRAELDAAVDRWLADILAYAPLRLPALIACLQSADGEEGVRAFREKRAPVWTGR